MRKTLQAIQLALLTLLLAAGASAAPGDKAASGLENARIKSGFRFQITDLPALRNAIAVQEKYTETLLSKPGMHGTGVSWAEDGSLIIKVLADVGASAAGMPETVDGIPVVIVHTGPVFALNVDCAGRGLKNCDTPDAQASAAFPPSQRDWHERPVPIGVSAGHVDVTAGTIACRVSRGCHKYALSNAHVFADENAGVAGDHILQPGPVDGGIDPDDSFATLYESVPIIMSISNQTKNRVDAAIALTAENMLGTATRPGGYGQPRFETLDPAAGMNVMKFGRTTGFKTGYIDIINFSVNVGYKEGNARFVGQIVIKSSTEGIAFSKPGDSGSLIVRDDDAGPDDRKPVGLLFASTSDNIYTIANPINDVLTALDIDIDGD